MARAAVRGAAESGEAEGVSSEITLHTGCAGSSFTIHVDWFDHNNIRRTDHVQIRIADRDKPRTLQVLINGMIVAQRESE